MKHESGRNSASPPILRRSEEAWIVWNQCSLDVSHSVISSECNPTSSRTQSAFGLSSHFRFGTPYWTVIGQSTCRSVFGATCQSMKRLSATMIPTSRIHSLLCAPNGWLLIDTHDTCAVCESH